MAQVKPKIESFARIKVIGVGGGGCNAVSRMVEQRIRGVDFVGINTDAQALHNCKAAEKILVGKNTTRGLGAGMNIELGKKAIEESKEKIEEVLKGADMVFVTCGLGGGTGTPGAPVVAEIARNLGALTIGVATKPFSFEGKKRMEVADEGLQEFKDKLDSLILIPNDKILGIVDDNTSLLNAFSSVDSVLSEAVQSISDLITKPGIVNLDFADIRTVMKDSGWALMGAGRAKSEGRMETAVKGAVNSPLLEISIEGAKGVLFSIAGGEDLTMKEIDEGAKQITKAVDPEAKVIFGAIIDDTLRKNEVKVTVIATGFDGFPEKKEETQSESQMKEGEGVEVVDTNIGEEQGENSEEKSEEREEKWDTPAFLRRKNKKQE